MSGTTTYTGSRPWAPRLHSNRNVTHFTFTCFTRHAGILVTYLVFVTRSESRSDAPLASCCNRTREELPQHRRGPDRAQFGRSGPSRAVRWRSARPGWETPSTITRQSRRRGQVTAAGLSWRSKVKVILKVVLTAHVSTRIFLIFFF